MDPAQHLQADNNTRILTIVGSVNEDLQIHTPRLPRLGETVAGGRLARGIGGKGFNQAVAAARAGVTTRLVAAVGDDPTGRAARGAAVAEGIDVRHLQFRPGSATGTALITVAEGQNTIVVAPGANDSIEAMPLDLGGPGSALLAQLEIPVDVVAQLFAEARTTGVTTVLNASPLANLDRRVVELSNMLIVNEIECHGIFGAIPDPDRPEATIDVAYAGTLVVTFGANGAAAWVDGQLVARCLPLKVEALDSTGAGDCFAGYLIAATVSGHSLDQALDIANRAAARSVTRIGAAASIPHLTEIDNR